MKTVRSHGFGWALCLCGMMGCDPAVSPDPPSNGPELAGRWKIAGDVGGSYGYLTTDQTGERKRSSCHT